MRLDGAQVKKRVRRPHVRPPPMLEPDVFRNQMYCIEESICGVTLLELFGAPRSHSVPP